MTETQSETQTFTQTFWTPYEQYQDKIGQTFEVIRPLNETEYDQTEVGEMWEIQCEDGTVIQAFSEEICKEVVNATRKFLNMEPLA